MGRKTAILCACLIIVSACGRGGQVANSDISTGPDEFSVVTQRPLEDPASFTALPDPTLGSANLADIDPNQNAIAALGGRTPAAGIPQSDAALVSHAQRFGVDPEIRSNLNERSTRRLFGGGMALDAYAELDRFRALGVATPSAPPAP